MRDRIVTVWGLLSDIHGNLAALERALAQLRERGVQRIAVLGDNLGRGDSDACVERIRSVADVSVVGNRDLDWQERVSQQSRSYVLGLPRLARVDDFVFTHGDSRFTRDLSTAETRTGFRRARAWLAANDAHFWFFGHSHQARVWRLDVTGDSELLFDAATDSLPTTVSLNDLHSTTVSWAINVGSIGLPFPGKGPASAAVYDRERQQIDLLPV